MTPHFLPLVGTSGPHGSRSRMTCKYRCANQCDHPDPNQSGNPHIQALLAKAVARRTVLAAGATAYSPTHRNSTPIIKRQRRRRGNSVTTATMSEHSHTRPTPIASY
jgi:hypothetical protein